MVVACSKSWIHSIELTKWRPATHVDFLCYATVYIVLAGDTDARALEMQRAAAPYVLFCFPFAYLHSSMPDMFLLVCTSICVSLYYKYHTLCAEQCNKQDKHGSMSCPVSWATLRRPLSI